MMMTMISAMATAIIWIKESIVIIVWAGRGRAYYDDNRAAFVISINDSNSSAVFSDPIQYIGASRKCVE